MGSRVEGKTRKYTKLGEEAEEPVLTPNTLIKGSPTTFPEEDLDKLHYLDEDKLVTKRICRYMLSAGAGKIRNRLRLPSEILTQHEI